MFARAIGTTGFVTSLLLMGGCTTIPGSSDANVGDVAAKAERVAASVGGANGFGGMGMTGYRDHAPNQMGFNSTADLASSSGQMTVRLHNESDEDCQFRLSYFARHEGLGEQMMNVDVNSGGEMTVSIPCAEMVGMGPLETPGEVGCVLGSGETVPNTMAVPGFLGLDFECGGEYEHFLTPDVDDLDGDGDTEELIIQSEGMQFHLQNGGPGGHGHGFGMGMMGPHFQGNAATNMGARALNVAERIGGVTGFGGMMMEGYSDHAEEQMGFHDDADLASPNGTMMLQISNDSIQDAEFHAAYIASHMGLDENMMDATVPAGEVVVIELPCAEIVGMGSLEDPDAAGCHLDDETPVPNTMMVPGFLGQDFVCGGTYGCTLTPDVDDLDGDGDTEELVIISDGMQTHMTNGGVEGHMHGSRSGMMGPHFSGGGFPIR
ncbi:MAG: hypothetical protein DHS20C16_22850 [Phycisphaerae bacterium]|nr:MAG: hypothetical protein DHS20C16_22850 [Phycisphaerae bacterium]